MNSEDKIPRTSRLKDKKNPEPRGFGINPVDWKFEVGNPFYVKMFSQLS